MSARRGLSLIEMIATIAVIGISASVAMLAVRRFTPPSPNDPATIVDDTLRTVLATGRSVTLTLQVDGNAVSATINADGSIVADSALHFNRFAGRTHAP